MIKVLVVDDSAFMRKALSMMLERDEDIRVVDTARDGREGLRKVKSFQPDVVTMDVEMPRMDGLEALRRIMAEAPRPVLMISSLTCKGAQTTLDALDAGAVDFIPKQTSGGTARIMGLQDTLISKVKAIAGTQPRPPSQRSVVSAPPTDSASPTLPAAAAQARLITIGVSTGGPKALQAVIPHLPGDLPVPVAVVQHMPAHFTHSLAKRLNELSALTVEEAADDMALKAGHVVIAAGGHHLTFRHHGGQWRAAISTEPSNTLHRPSVDLMFQSAAESFGGKILALVMTGMGKDGSTGAAHIKERGGTVIAQDEATSIVYGMPRAVAEAGLTDAVLPLSKLAGAVSDALYQQTNS